jgi:hypothetical protein
VRICDRQEANQLGVKEAGKASAHLEKLVGHAPREVPVVESKMEELVFDRKSLVVGVGP